MIKITKPKAKALFEAGDKISIIPYKVSLDNMWMQPVEIQISTTEEKDFDKIVNAFEYYNCNSELGTHAAFYFEPMESQNELTV